MKPHTGNIKKPKFFFSFIVSFLIMLVIFFVAATFYFMPDYFAYKNEVEEDRLYYVDNLFDYFCAYVEREGEPVFEPDSHLIKLFLLDHYRSTGQNLKLRVFRTSESNEEYAPPVVEDTEPVLVADTSQTAYLKYITPESDVYYLLLADNKYLEYFNTPEVKAYKHEIYDDGVRTFYKIKQTTFICNDFYADLENGTFIPVKAEILKDGDLEEDDPQRSGVEINIVPDNVEGYTHVISEEGIYDQLGAVEGCEDAANIKWSKNAERLGYNFPANYYFDYFSTNMKSVPFVVIYQDQVLVAAVLILLFSYVLAFIPAVISYKIKMRRYQIFEYRRMTTDAMAHDLKTPIAAISALAENISNHIGTDKQDYYAGKILEKTDEMNGLVNGILNYSRSENSNLKIKKVKVDIGQLIQEIISDNESLINKRGLKVDPDLKKVVIKTDRELFRQAIANLISNAVIHSEEGTVIDISCDNDAITIINTVTGTIEDINELRQPFVKGSSSRGDKGTGLGLAIADNNLKLLRHKLDLGIEGERFKATVRI